MRGGTVLLAAAILAGITVLCALGLWQVNRLAWKEDLIARIEARRHAEPEPVDAVLAAWQRSADVDYRPVRLAGRFDHAAEQYFYTTARDGAVGWNLFTPLHLPDGRVAIVNRGFVPMALREPAARAEGAAGAVTGDTVTVTGLARDPLPGKPNRFVPDNRPDKREWYWRDVPAMARAMGLDPARTLPFTVDAEAGPAAGGWPRGGQTLVSLPNNHLQYAVTWFGLAVALAGVGGLFLWRRLRGAGRTLDAAGSAPPSARP